MSRPSSPAPVTPEQLSSHIEQDIATCQSLLQLLEAERQALQERNLDLLDDVITQKAKGLQRLEDSARTRTRWVQANNPGRQAPDAAWQTLLAAASEELLDRWQLLKGLFAECQMQNGINGKVLARKQTTYNQLLGLLRGQPNATKLYTAKGAPGPSRSGYDLGEA